MKALLLTLSLFITLPAFAELSDDEIKQKSLTNPLPTTLATAPVLTTQQKEVEAAAKEVLTAAPAATPPSASNATSPPP